MGCVSIKNHSSYLSQNQRCQKWLFSAEICHSSHIFKVVGPLSGFFGQPSFLRWQPSSWPSRPWPTSSAYFSCSHNASCCVLPEKLNRIINYLSKYLPVRQQCMGKASRNFEIHEAESEISFLILLKPLYKQ